MPITISFLTLNMEVASCKWTKISVIMNTLLKDSIKLVTHGLLKYTINIKVFPYPNSTPKPVLKEKENLRERLILLLLKLKMSVIYQNLSVGKKNLTPTDNKKIVVVVTSSLLFKCFKLDLRSKKTIMLDFQSNMLLIVVYTIKVVTVVIHISLTSLLVNTNLSQKVVTPMKEKLLENVKNVILPNLVELMVFQTLNSLEELMVNLMRKT